MAPNIAHRLPRVPLSCIFEITNACNLRCVHCESASGKRLSNELTTDEVLALLPDLKTAGCRTVNLTGGEPLLREDWPLIARTLSDMGVNVHLVTNGLLLDDNSLSLAGVSGVRGIAISLDGPKEVHDAVCRPGPEVVGSRYDAAVAAIRRVAASPLKTGVITMIHKKNSAHLEEMCATLAQIGLDSWQVQIAMPIGRMAAIKDEYMLEPQEIEGIEALLARFIEEGTLPICKMPESVSPIGLMTS